VVESFPVTTLGEWDRHENERDLAVRYRTWVTIAVAFFGVVVGVVIGASNSTDGGIVPPRAFYYGLDFAGQGPYPGGGADANAVASARRVLTSIPGMLEDTSIMDWGLPDPEPSPGKFDFSAIASRIDLITSTGGIPVITLCSAPSWMKSAPGPGLAPTPGHYRDFAALAAKIAQSFPQVKYFLVWNELKGFWSHAANNWNIRGYTVMYNDVYTAIKLVRPDALVGGPYAPTPPYPAPRPKNLKSTPRGAWGYLDQRTLNAIRFWLTHKAGADFVAVDGPDFPKTGPIADPLTATQKYAAVDRWLRHQTSLPIWWVESPVQPANSGWSEARAMAIRVAALIRLVRSGTRVAMQWLGRSVSDEGLWTTIEQPGGGRPTPLAHVLPRVLSVLRYRLSVVASPHGGVLIARGRGGTIAVNTTSVSVATVIKGNPVMLGPGQVLVAKLALPCCISVKREIQYSTLDTDEYAIADGRHRA
jgi:hypothetical protein